MLPEAAQAGPVLAEARTVEARTAAAVVPEAVPVARTAAAEAAVRTVLEPVLLVPVAAYNPEHCPIEAAAAAAAAAVAAAYTAAVGTDHSEVPAGSSLLLTPAKPCGIRRQL